MDINLKPGRKKPPKALLPKRPHTQEKKHGEHGQPWDPEALSEAEEERKGKKRALAPKKRAHSSTDPRSTRLHNGERVTGEEKVREYDGAKNGVAWTESLNRPERTRRRREEKGEGALAPWVPLLRKEAGNFAQPAHSGRRCPSTAPEEPGCLMASHEKI